MRLQTQGRRLAVSLLSVLLLTACGNSDKDDGAGRPDRNEPVLGGRDDAPSVGPARIAPKARRGLDFPVSATKNTTRVGGSDPVANAAGVALAVFPSRTRSTRPAAVSLVDRDDWRTAISAAQLMSEPVRAPLLFSQDGSLPEASASALEALAPTGAATLAGAQAIAVGDGQSLPPSLKRRDLEGGDYASRARAIDQLQTQAAGQPTRAVLVAPADRPELAMPAAGWAAKAGTPVLWVQGAVIPPATRAAIRDHRRPRIYLLGPESAIPRSVARELARLGRVRRIAGSDGVRTSVAFARYSNAGFGWNTVDPGHGFVFARTSRPLDAAAAAPLSASGKYGPLLLLSSAGRLDKPVEDYLLDVQPGYDSDPVRGVYNHGWLVGDVATLSADVQGRIDALLEIQPVDPIQTAP